MLTNLCLILLLAFADTPRPATSEQRIVPVKFTSTSVQGQRNYLVWLPPGYDAASDYPVIVLLHGLGGEGAEWFNADEGNATPLFLRMLEQQRVPPFIAIAPDGGTGYWTDHLGAPAERYGALIDEVVADADQRYALDTKRVAIVGVSMGGHGALSRAFMTPDRYVAAVSLSGALFDVPPTHRPIYKKVWGSPADRDHWLATAPMAIVERMKSDERLPAMFIAYGRSENERFVGWNTAARALLERLGREHTFMAVDGAHSWATWRGLGERWLTWLSPRLR